MDTLEEKILKTLEIADRRGYALTLEQLSDLLYGGRAPREAVMEAIRGLQEVVGREGIYCLEGREALLDRARERRESNEADGKRYATVARAFASEFMALCPFVKSISLAGSLASDGFHEGDDLDFDLLVEDGRKYTTYLLGVLLSMRYSLRYRAKPARPEAKMLLLRKVICLNVLWTVWEAFPFSRQDEYMAYELLLMRPLQGVDYHRQVLESNPWLGAHFPQIYEIPYREVEPPERGPFARLLERVYSRPGLAALGEGFSRSIAYALWRLVQLSRRKNPEALRRVEHVRRMQRPYTLFED
ncbi:MAG: hypothetical protein AABX40_09140 [Candidatus Hydrothermarchaeota archaeon]